MGEGNRFNTGRFFKGPIIIGKAAVPVTGYELAERLHWHLLSPDFYFLEEKGTFYIF